MTDADLETHDRQVTAVAQAVAKLLPKLNAQGFTPEAIFEGAVKGGATALLAGTSASAEEVAGLLEEMAVGFRNLEKPNLHVVQ
ncbi:hypothetical protein [Shinella fusca]|uniref:Uncharacterized protein n=1 Tax=Shinella fusca TaxID=544480 RepID=A0A7W7YXD1_9HYPH|nr:hypothetical protein [Shinella fusca]MBB5044026.1 hypothetical protein [Shinella fusca]